MAVSRPKQSRNGRPALASTPWWHRSFQLIRFGLALLGLSVALAMLLLATQPGVRESAESRLIGWLQQRQGPIASSTDSAARLVLQTQQRLENGTVAVDDSPVMEEVVVEQAAVVQPTIAEPAIAALAVAEPVPAVAIADESVLAADPKNLPRAQAKVAYWLSKKYRVAPEPLSVLVAEAWEIGKRQQIDWTLILAVMAVESSFNPFAQSSVGAQGLMQVMTGIHSEKYDSAGGKLAAFDPVTNLRVGVAVLLECIARAGSLEDGLKYYVGAANLSSDNGYSKRVLAERARLKKVAAGPAVS